MAKNLKQLNKSSIIIYQSSKREVELKVRFEKETVWLRQNEIAELFAKDRSVITKHIKQIFKDKEADKKSNVHFLHIAGSDKPIAFYGLDVILAVGYRTNSSRAIHFRQWATKVLKNYLLKGYAINEKRLLEARNKFFELQNAITFLRKKSKAQLLKGQEKKILNLLADYSKTLSILEQYDKNQLKSIKGAKSKFILRYEGGKELYCSIEEKAAHLLYLTIKDHPFIDGNKRIGSFLFVYFLDKNDFLFKKNGERKINDNGLTALALLIAESDPKDKDVLIKIVTNLLV